MSDIRKIVSLYWGYSIGGVGKYATLIDKARDYAPIDIKHVCIMRASWHCDIDTLNLLTADIVKIKGRWDISWISRVAEIVRAHRPDLIISHGFNGHTVSLALKYIKDIHTPRAASYHGLYHATTLVRRAVAPIYNRLTEHFIRRHVVKAISVAEFSKRYLIYRGVPARKIDVIHNGIPDYEPAFEARATIRCELGIKDADILVLVASRLDPVKGISFLLQGFQKVHKRFPNTKLVVIGAGTLEKQLVLETKNLGIESCVSFPGFRSDIPDCLVAADIFALPSLAEYHSIGLLEAMRGGIPIISTDVGGNTESVRSEQEAVLVPPADADAIAVALERLLVDADFAAHLGRQARQRFLDHFTEKNMIQHTAHWLVSAAA